MVMMMSVMMGEENTTRNTMKTTAMRMMMMMMMMMLMVVYVTGSTVQSVEPTVDRLQPSHKILGKACLSLSHVASLYFG